MRKNTFTLKMSKKSNAELEGIIQDKSSYTEEALQAVIWELENRNLIEKDEIILEETAAVEGVQFSEKINKNNESVFEEFENPILYSKKAVQGFTIFFGPLFGAVLLMFNLKAVNKPKARMQVLVFGIGYTLFSFVGLNYLPKMFLITLIFNVIGYVVLVEYFWNQNLGKELQYKTKEITKALIISLLFTLIMLFILISNNGIPGMKL